MMLRGFWYGFALGILLAFLLSVTALCLILHYLP